MLAPPYVKIRNPILYLKQIQDMKDGQEGNDNSGGDIQDPLYTTQQNTIYGEGNLRPPRRADAQNESQDASMVRGGWPHSAT